MPALGIQSNDISLSWVGLHKPCQAASITGPPHDATAAATAFQHHHRHHLKGGSCSCATSGSACVHHQTDVINGNLDSSSSTTCNGNASNSDGHFPHTNGNLINGDVNLNNGDVNCSNGNVNLSNCNDYVVFPAMNGSPSVEDLPSVTPSTSGLPFSYHNGLSEPSVRPRQRRFPHLRNDAPGGAASSSTFSRFSKPQRLPPMKAETSKQNQMSHRNESNVSEASTCRYPKGNSDLSLDGTAETFAEEVTLSLDNRLKVTDSSSLDLPAEAAAERAASPALPLEEVSSFQTSYAGVSESAGAWGELGHYNLLHVTTRDPGQHWYTRYSCYLVHCCRLRVNFPYPVIHNTTILADDRVQVALEQSVAEAADSAEGGALPPASLMKRHVLRSHTLLNNMKAAISTTLIRLTGYVLFKVFSRLLKSVVVHKGQLEAIQQASKQGTPLIFVPLHRSHVDYLFVTWVLFNCQIPAPIVAAGDNLNMPVFGALLRGTGGFFIKRRLESDKARRDVLYRALLQCYISRALHAGYNLEFFIEGGRTRTGKAAMPKGGLLSVILDAYLSGLLDDALIVPIAINYDRLLDGNFIREQLGQSKVPESFWGAVCAICKVLSTNYGQSRIDFGAPFSLKEFVQTSRIPVAQLQATGTPLSLSSFSTQTQTRGHHRSLSSPVSASHPSARRHPSNPPILADTSPAVPADAPLTINPAQSNSSLFGTDLTDEFRELVQKLGRHIVFDAERCQAIMSTNLVSWVLSFMHRSGATLPALATALDDMRLLLRGRGRDVGFTGAAVDVVQHAVHLLGPSLIHTKVADGETLYRPVTLLPNVIELNYYSNALLPVFALDAIVGTSILSVLECDLWSYVDCDIDVTLELDKVMKHGIRLCELLCLEFVFVAPCGQLAAKLLDAVVRLEVSGFLTEQRRSSLHRRHHQQDTDSWFVQDEDPSSDESDSGPTYTTVYSVTPTLENLKWVTAFASTLTPVLDAYCAVVQALPGLLEEQGAVAEQNVVMRTQAMMKEQIKQGTLQYGESIAADPIKNCIKMLEDERVLECSSRDGRRWVALTKEYASEQALGKLLQSFRTLRP